MASGAGARPRRSAGRLLDEVAVLEHAGQLDDALELQLAPAAAYGGLAHRFGEARGLFVQQREMRLDEVAQLLVEARVRVDARALDLAELAVDLRQRLFDRLHERVDGLLARADRPARALGTVRAGPSRAPGRSARAVERLGAERLELRGERGCVATSASLSAAAFSCSSARACSAASSSRVLPPRAQAMAKPSAKPSGGGARE